MLGSHLPDRLNETVQPFPIPVLTSIGSLVRVVLLINYFYGCSVNEHLQDGLSLTYARREAEEGRKAEEANPAYEGYFPVIVVQQANHAQISNGL